MVQGKVDTAKQTSIEMSELSVPTVKEEGAKMKSERT